MNSPFLNALEQAEELPHGGFNISKTATSPAVWSSSSCDTNSSSTVVFGDESSSASTTPTKSPRRGGRVKTVKGFESLNAYLKNEKQKLSPMKSPSTPKRTRQTSNTIRVKLQVDEPVSASKSKKLNFEPVSKKGSKRKCSSPKKTCLNLTTSNVKIEEDKPIIAYTKNKVLDVESKRKCSSSPKQIYQDYTTIKVKTKADGSLSEYLKEEQMRIDLENAKELCTSSKSLETTKGKGSGSAVVALKEKKLRGIVTGGNLIGLKSLECSPSNSSSQPTSSNRRQSLWNYTIPRVNQPVIQQPDSSIADVAIKVSSGISFTDHDITSPSSSEIDTSDGSAVFGRPVSIHPISRNKKWELNCASNDSDSSSTDDKMLEITSTETWKAGEVPEIFHNSNKKFKSYHVDKMEKQNEVSEASSSRNSVTLSNASRKSLAALEENIKGVTETYSGSSESIESQLSPPLSAHQSPPVSRETTDSTIAIPSDDDAKKEQCSSKNDDKAEIQEREKDVVDLISDADVVEEEISPKSAASIVLAVCPGCGIWTGFLAACTRCPKDFNKTKPKKYKAKIPVDGELVCTSCGKLVQDKSFKKGESLVPFICQSCKHRVVSRTNTRSVVTTLGTKQFYNQQFQQFGNVNVNGRTFNSVKRTAKLKRQPLKSGLPNRRNKGRTKPEPECISLIDSDDEDEATASTQSQVPPNQSVKLKPDTRKSKMRNKAGQQISPHLNGVVITPVSRTNLITSPSSANVLVCPVVQRITSIVNKNQQVSNIQITPLPSRNLCGAEWDDSSQTLTIDLVLLGFGSKRFMINPPRASMSPNGFKFHFNVKEHGCVPVELKLNDIEKLRYGLSRQLPSFFAEATPAFALTVRSRMNMKKSEGFYDPHSKEEYEQYLFFRPHETCINEALCERMSEVIFAMVKNKGKPDVFREIKMTDVNILLGRIASPDTLAQSLVNTKFITLPNSISLSTASPSIKSTMTPLTLAAISTTTIGTSMTPIASSTINTSSVMATIGAQPITVIAGSTNVTQALRGQSSVRLLTSSDKTVILIPSSEVKKSEPPVKLITYPPPPAMGGITVTSEDMECLQDGEFLNDVIIEFYLKYLLEEKLSKQDRERTHIFSSFFYKRLTQREYGSRSSDQSNELKLTPQEKRHLKVRKWTRRVDLFEKDFIIIPINENSHWYVVFICFPSRVAEGQSTISIPITKAESSAQSEASKDESVDSTTEDTEDSQDGGMPEEEKDSIEDNQGKAECRQSPTEMCADVDSTTTVEDKSSSQEEGQSSSAIQQEASNDVKTNGSDDKAYNAFHKVKREIPCIFIMDSLKSLPKRHVMQKLREYLEIEWRTRKNTTCRFTTQNMKGGHLDVPQQSNFSDCGVYVLQYVEQFFKKPIKNFKVPIKGLSNWFPEVEVKAKRAAITQLVMDLNEKQKPTTSDAT